MQCLLRKKDEEFYQFFVLFLSVGNIFYWISKTVLESTHLLNFFVFYSLMRFTMFSYVNP